MLIQLRNFFLICCWQIGNQKNDGLVDSVGNISIGIFHNYPSSAVLKLVFRTPFFANCKKHANMDFFNYNNIFQLVVWFSLTFLNFIVKSFRYWVYIIFYFGKIKGKYLHIKTDGNLRKACGLIRIGYLRFSLQCFSLQLLDVVSNLRQEDSMRIRGCCIYCSTLFCWDVHRISVVQLIGIWLKRSEPSKN